MELLSVILLNKIHNVAPIGVQGDRGCWSNWYLYKKFLKVFEIITGIYFVSRSAPSLAESDVLCTILLARLLFPTNEKLEDLFSYRKPDDSGSTTEEMKSPASITVTPPLERYESAVEGDDSLDEENVYWLNLLCLNKKIFNYP